MTVTAYLYGSYLTKAVCGSTANEMKWTANGIKCILCTSTYAPAQDTHAWYSDVTSEHTATGSGYTVGGVSLTAQTATYSTDNTLVLDGADAVWANSTITAKYAVIYDASAGSTAGSQPLIGYVDFGADQSSSSGTFTVQWSTAGIVKITVS